MKQLAKKILITLAIMVSSISIMPLFTQSAFADEEVPSTSSGTEIGDCSNTFLGMTPWYCGVISNPSNEEDLKDNTWTIAANVFVDISVIATYLVIGYIIYGGYLYMFSSGDPTKAIVGKKTLTRAFIGLAIVMLANIILNTIRIAIFKGNGTIQGCNPAVSECVNPSTLVENLINWFVGASSIVAVIFIVVGGVGYMTSNGDPGKLQKAKTTILYAVIGLIIVALSSAIAHFVFHLINNHSDFNTYTVLLEDSIAQEKTT